MNKSDIKLKVFFGFGWKLGERIAAKGIEFLVSLVLARILLPHDYGIIAMVLVFIAIADVFVNSGFATSLIQKKDANETDFSTIFYCSLVCSIIIYAILFVSAPFISDFYNAEILTPVIRVFALRIPLSVYNSIQHAYVSRHMMFKKFFWSTLFGTLISGVVGIVMAVWGLGVWALIGQYFTNTIIDTLVLAVTVKWRPRLLFSWCSAKALMNYGWKVLAADLSGTFFDQLRNLIVGKVYLPSDLAFYNRGQQFPNLINHNLTASIMAVLFPALSETSDDLHQAKAMTRRAMQVLSFTIFPLMFGMLAVAKPMVRILLTPKWDSCVIYLQLFCISGAFSVLSNISLQTIKAIGKSGVLLKIEFIKKPIYLFLLIIGTRISVLAVATTMLVYSFYGLFVNMFQLKKHLEYSLTEQWKDFYKNLFTSSIMAAVLLIIQLLNINDYVQILIQIICGIIVYFSLSRVFNTSIYYYVIGFVKGLVKYGERK